MTPTYGFLKATIGSTPTLKSSRHGNETQYHIHTTLLVTNSDGTSTSWDSAANVGTNDSDDLLQYKLVYDFAPSFLETLQSAPQGFTDLTGTSGFPALDFLRSNVLQGTGPWRMSGVMDGTDRVEPVASLLSLLQRAQANQGTLYIFGRSYTDGVGIHDIHMNQGSTGAFLNHGPDDTGDHNEIWQDGAVLVDLGEPQFAAYISAFTKQLVPTDNLGNPQDDSHPLTAADDGSLAIE